MSYRKWHFFQESDYVWLWILLNISGTEIASLPSAGSGLSAENLVEETQWELDQSRLCWLAWRFHVAAKDWKSFKEEIWRDLEEPQFQLLLLEPCALAQIPEMFKDVFLEEPWKVSSDPISTNKWETNECLSLTWVQVSSNSHAKCLFEPKLSWNYKRTRRAGAGQQQ